MAYRQAGEETAPAVLLVHGYPESSYMWHRALPALAFRVLTGSHLKTATGAVAHSVPESSLTGILSSLNSSRSSSGERPSVVR